MFATVEEAIEELREGRLIILSTTKIARTKAT